MLPDEVKYYDCAKAEDVDDESRTVVAVISSDRVDRDNEVLVPKGAVIDEFKKNPVILWNHDAYQLPIGKALWVKRKDNQLLAKIKFAMTDMAQTVYELFKGGFLQSFSIRFRPLEGHAPTQEEIKSNPAWKLARFVFTKWELLEASPVTIPANPDALVQAIKSKSFTKTDMASRLMKVIDDSEEILFEVTEPEVPPVYEIKEQKQFDIVEELVDPFISVEEMIFEKYGMKPGKA